MIAGTLILEDITINFNIDDNNTANYTVSENVEGQQESCQCPGEDFMNGLCVALRYSGEPLNEDEAKAAEEIQPKNPKLRFIP